jgi:hypothetical protein
MARSVMIIATLCLTFLKAGSVGATAGERGDWFDSLKMPGTKASCCDVADCQAVEADWRQGAWWVLVNDRWRPVPESKVLKSPRSIDGSAYVCIGPATWSVGGPTPPEGPIYCFVPPNWPT